MDNPVCLGVVGSYPDYLFPSDVRPKVRARIREHYECGYNRVVTGITTRFEQIAAEETLQLKKECRNLWLEIRVSRIEMGQYIRYLNEKTPLPYVWRLYREADYRGYIIKYGLNRFWAYVDRCRAILNRCDATMIYYDDTEIKEDLCGKNILLWSRYTTGKLINLFDE